MTTTQQTKPVNTQTAQTTSPTDFERLLQQGQDKTKVEYQAFGGDAVVRLSVDIVQKLIAKRTRKGATCSKEDAIRFIAMCQAKHLNPFEGDAYLTGYDTQDGPVFNLVTAHQVYMKRAELNPRFDGMQSGIVILGEDGPFERETDFHLPAEVVVGGWARVHLKDQAQPTYRKVRLARFDKGVSVWKDDAAGMICKCAEVDALRSAFPNSLGGCYLREEVQIDLKPEDLRNLALPPRRPRNGNSLVESVQNFEPRTVDAAAEPEDNINTDPDPADATSTKAEPAKATPQVELSDAVLSAGGTFDDFQKWCVETGVFPECDAVSRFSELKNAEAVRLLRSKGPMLKAIAAMKGGVE